MPTLPFIVGFSVTLVAALTGWFVLNEWVKSASGLDAGLRRELEWRWGRDIDAVQSAATILAAAVCFVPEESEVDGSGLVLAVLAGSLLVLITIFALLRISPRRYRDWSWGVFTPLTDLLLVVNAAGLVVSFCV